MARGLDTQSENITAVNFYNEAAWLIVQASEHGRNELHAFAALQLVWYTVFAGAGAEWRPALDIARDWLAQLPLSNSDDPKAAFSQLSDAAKLVVKMTIVSPPREEQ